MTLFVDTGYFIAIVNRRDQHHAAAAQAEVVGHRLVTTSSVVNESIQLLHRRGLLSLSLDLPDSIRMSGQFEIIHPSAELQHAAWNTFKRMASAGASPVDCLSFAVMEQAGISRALTFDEHFRIAGFEIL